MLLWLWPRLVSLHSVECVVCGSLDAGCGGCLVPVEVGVDVLDRKLEPGSQAVPGGGESVSKLVRLRPSAPAKIPGAEIAQSHNDYDECGDHHGFDDCCGVDGDCVDDGRVTYFCWAAV